MRRFLALTREEHLHYRLNATVIDEIISDIRCATCSLATSQTKENEQ